MVANHLDQPLKTMAQAIETMTNSSQGDKMTLGTDKAVSRILSEVEYVLKEQDKFGFLQLESEILKPDSTRLHGLVGQVRLLICTGRRHELQSVPHQY